MFSHLVEYFPEFDGEFYLSLSSIFLAGCYLNAFSITPGCVVKTKSVCNTMCQFSSEATIFLRELLGPTFHPWKTYSFKWKQML